MKFKIIVCGRNCFPWVEGCLNSLATQTDGDFDVCVVDDASDDGTAEIVREMCDRLNWQYVVNARRMGAMFNQVHAIRMLDEGQPDDVIVFVDMDDRLADDTVLAYLRKVYQRGYKVVYGQYRSEPHSRTCNPAEDYPLHVKRGNSYRKHGLLFNHLRTLKYEIFNQLTDADFTFSNGEWFQACCDAAIMIPALELSKGNYYFNKRILYVYNSENPTSDWRRQARVVNKVHYYILNVLAPKV